MTNDKNSSRKNRLENFSIKISYAISFIQIKFNFLKRKRKFNFASNHSKYIVYSSFQFTVS